MQPIIFQSVTAAQIARLKDALQSGGSDVIPTNDSSFHVKGHGIEATATFLNGVLSVFVNKRPWFVTTDMLEAGIQQNLGGE